MFLRKSLFWLPSLAAIALLGSGSSAIAQTVEKVSNQPLTESPNQLSVEPETQNQNISTVSDVTGVPQFPNITTVATPSPIVTPFPGTVATSSAALGSGYTALNTQTDASQAVPSDKLAQTDIDPGRTTRGGRSYVGVAGNIGLSGSDSALGDGNFAVISKVGLTNTISVRPSAILGDNTTFLIPITYDLTLRQGGDVFNEPLPIAPYIGVGAAIKTGNDSQVAFLVSGGIDVPLNPQFTATAAVNAGFFDQTDIGLLLGVGYNFTGF